MTAFQTKLAPMESLEQVLPALLNNLSLARAQIAIDQIRGAIASKSLDSLVFATASDSDVTNDPLAAVIAIQQTSARSDQVCDAASVIHAGSLRDPSSNVPSGMITALSSELEHEMQRRGVCFMQWATDPVSRDLDDTANESVANWCRGFGFQPIGTLDYLGGDVPPAMNGQDKCHELRFTAIDWNRPDQFERFTDLVEQTYIDTRDCPQLANYRTALQTLRGYQTSTAFDPNLWLFADNTGNSPVGCVVLANHKPAAQSENEKFAPVVEIVYMGLVPAARGKGYGKLLLQRVFDEARGVGAGRIILAVDRENMPARTIYQRAGLEQMLNETVWVKSLTSDC